MVRILGIDPGQHGGFCFRDTEDDEYMNFYAYNKLTVRDIVGIIECEKETCRICGIPIKAFIEQVHSMPHDGKASAFSFGKNFGMWLGIITALKLPCYEIPPAAWQAGLKLRLRGKEYREKKKALKEIAQKYWPQYNITYDTCDAILIAEFGRRKIIEEKSR